MTISVPNDINLKVIYLEEAGARKGLNEMVRLRTATYC
jgi:hypothetical protein